MYQGAGCEIKKKKERGVVPEDGFNQIIINKKLVINSYHYKINIPFKEIYNYIYINVTVLRKFIRDEESNEESFGSFPKNSVPHTLNLRTFVNRI